VLSSVEKLMSNGQGNPSPGDQLIVLTDEKEIYIFTQKDCLSGWERFANPRQAYEVILGKTKVNAGLAMLLFWHKYGLETEAFLEVEDRIFLRVMGAADPSN